MRLSYSSANASLRGRVSRGATACTLCTLAIAAACGICLVGCGKDEQTGVGVAKTAPTSQSPQAPQAAAHTPPAIQPVAGGGVGVRKTKQ